MKNLYQYCWLALGLGLASCSEDEKAPAAMRSTLPNHFKVVGEAVGTDGALSIDCICDLQIELEGEPTQSEGVVEYRGVHGGHFRRTVLDSQGDGISLSPDVHGEIIIRVYEADSISLTIPINLGSESSFYRETAQFKGTSSENSLGSGQWNCAPFDLTEGWIDTVGTVQGTWRIQSE